MNNASINSFANHAPKIEWVREFFELGNEYWKINSLGPNQVSMFKRFLRDTGLIDKSALRQDVIISRQVEAAIVICINHIREAVHPIAVHHIAINRLAVLLRAVQVTLVQVAVTIINQILQTSHHIAVVQRKVQRQRRVHMTLMMMAMMISIWMTIMTMTDMTETAIMQMV